MIRTPWPLAFGIVAVVHLVLNGAEATPWDSITKCFLAPILVMWILRVGGPKILALALLLCFFGDLFMALPDAWFVAGMSAFALAHIGFIAYFISRGASTGFRQWWPAAVIYIVAVIGVVSWLWNGLDSGLRVPMTVYAILLVATAFVSLSVDKFAGVGGLMFLLSDTIIAIGKAGHSQPHPADLWIMALYLLGIFYLTSASLSLESRRAVT